MAARYYVRCTLCLSVSAIAGAVPAGLMCDCGGTVTTMGKVLPSWRLHVATRIDTPCDERCTHASGPKCDCPCGGQNHGTGRVIEVILTESVPRIRSASPARAAEFTAAVDAARARVVARFGVKQGWEPETLHWGRTQANRALAHARHLKTHNGRMKALAAICAAVPT